MRLDLRSLERELDAQAYLFDDPTAYRAGVRDALAAVQRDADAGLLGDRRARASRPA
jgi:hypothetical protein